ncbi:2OG-Fe(II) oxygenase family protein [Actinokineospora auranticolor]|uniref:2-oxoglutarate-Fe(II)-dependent oxygenase superfamily protein n=1 Tax=Actinokineospora auranticolor TaxID=155976 RepID=A0A2S6GK60_9PSEU|nr:2OG-Fe(II) oxygenase family protein [Actinokineospora auranticolor]PPK65541.1 2-oxoglutarate-Fe(II)-dependent oxygenase superfamily protein [Actinokineospora auranticolor]
MSAPFAATGHAQVRDETTVALCAEVADLVDACPDEAWTQVVRCRGELADYPLFPRDPRLDEVHRETRAEKERGLFCYSFARVADSAENADRVPWDRIKALLLAPDIVGLIAERTGRTVTSVDLAYVNCFRRGDFLTTHTDKAEPSTIAAAFSLTPNWDAGDGGCTYVLDRDRETVVDQVSPRLGALLLLDTLAVEVPHYVSEVTGDVGDGFVRKSLIARYS